MVISTYFYMTRQKELHHSAYRGSDPAFVPSQPGSSPATTHAFRCRSITFIILCVNTCVENKLPDFGSLPESLGCSPPACRCILRPCTQNASARRPRTSRWQVNMNRESRFFPLTRVQLVVVFGEEERGRGPVLSVLLVGNDCGVRRARAVTAHPSLE